MKVRRQFCTKLFIIIFFYFLKNIFFFLHVFEKITTKTFYYYYYDKSSYQSFCFDFRECIKRLYSIFNHLKLCCRSFST